MGNSIIVFEGGDGEMIMYGAMGISSSNQFPSFHQIENVYSKTFSERDKIFTMRYECPEEWIQSEETSITIPWIQPVFDIETIKREFSIPPISFIGETDEVVPISNEIAKYIDEELQLKISDDEYLKKVLLKSIEEIKKYLEKKDKKYEIRAFVWHDIESDDWEENIILVKVECKDNKEKREIWDEIDKIVGQQEEEEIVILTNVDKYELP